MFRSLRFRLPALFFAGIVLTGVVAAAIAFGLFQDYTQDQARQELRREAAGLTAALRRAGEQDPGAGQAARRSLRRSRSRPRAATACSTSGSPFFSGRQSGLKTLPREHGRLGGTQREGRRVRVRAAGRDEDVPRRRASALPREARQPSRRRSSWRRRRRSCATASRRCSSASRSRCSSACSSPTGLAWYLSGRITRPVRRLAKAADEVAEGHYDVELPDVPGARRDRRPRRSFRQMATRLGEAEELERNFLMTVSHELRTPLTAIRGPRRGSPRGRGRGSGGSQRLARRDRARGRQARAARRRRPRPREARHAPVHGAA